MDLEFSVAWGLSPRSWSLLRLKHNACCVNNAEAVIWHPGLLGFLNFSLNLKTSTNNDTITGSNCMHLLSFCTCYTLEVYIVIICLCMWVFSYHIFQ